MRALRLNTRGVRRVLSGRLWLERRDFRPLPDLEPGELVRLLTGEGHFVALAYVNPRSKILARILSWEDHAVDKTFFLRRLKEALSRRQEVYPGESCFRLVHGEGDLLPGLTVDVYDTICVVQMATAGMERLRDLVLTALRELLSPRALVLKNDLPARKEEGLSCAVEVLGEVPRPLRVQIDGLSYLVDPLSGQKTGFFLDQRENRRRLARYVGSRVVWDLYCYTGAFALAAARAGAKRVIAVDRSEGALALAEENARLNGLKDRIVFVQAEVEDFLGQASEAEVILLDPPAFIKHRRHFGAGLRRYRRLNYLALGRISPGGILFSSSCSHFLRLTDLEDLLRREAAEYRRYVQLLEYGMQALDHPPLLTMPETMYLKALFLRVF